MAAVAHSGRGEAGGRLAVLSLHTSPLDQPGTGDSGGMNVYVRALAERLPERGLAVDVFTRCRGREVPQVDQVGPLTRIVQVPAGPCAAVPKERLFDLLPAFAEGVLSLGDRPYDLIHAHYWLSGWAGRIARRRWGVPLVASFHTLGKVKNLAAADDPEPPRRLGGEGSVIRDADRILAPTPAEVGHLVELYGAPADRIRLVPPGVDLDRFRPGSREAARAALGLRTRRVALFVGRLQPLKGPDVAIRAVAEVVARAPGLDLGLAVVGGPSGSQADGPILSRLRALAARLGVADRVAFLPPQPHEDLPRVYAAADAVLVPSRSESFGLVSLEAQACGVPVVAAAVGGLRYAVAHGESGLLVEGHDPRAYADALLRVLSEPGLAERLSVAARRHAARHSWDRTVDLIAGVYAELVPGIAGADADRVVAGA